MKISSASVNAETNGVTNQGVGRAAYKRMLRCARHGREMPAYNGARGRAGGNNEECCGVVAVHEDGC
jgi:hypothetical protein